jgi:hypothetical protein
MKLRLLLPLFLLVPAVCAARLTPYQEQVAATFTAPGADKALRDAYEAVAAGTATQVQRRLIQSSESIYEDMMLARCTVPAVAKAGALDDVIGKVVDAGHGPELVADVRKLFLESEWKPAIPASASLKDQALDAAVLLAKGSRPESNPKTDPMLVLRRRMTLNYHLSFITGGECVASPQLKRLIGKDLK